MAYMVYRGFEPFLCVCTKVSTPPIAFAAKFFLEVGKKTPVSMVPEFESSIERYEVSVPAAEPLTLYATLVGSGFVGIESHSTGEAADGVAGKRLENDGCMYASRATDKFQIHPYYLDDQHHNHSLFLCVIGEDHATVVRRVEIVVRARQTQSSFCKSHKYESRATRSRRVFVFG